MIYVAWLVFLQDPTDLDKFNIQAFYYIRKNLKLADEGKSGARLVIYPCFF